MARIPTLDGWRGIAILLVLIDHFQLAAKGHFLRPWTQTGQHGVTIFFVLSGYLITTGLIEKPIDLRKFYIRRFARLMPAAWLFLATVISLFLFAGVRPIPWRVFEGCLLFYRNFQNVGGITGHFWSLSIEEQYYLVWPSLLLLFGIRRCRWIAGLGAVSIAVYRWYAWKAYSQGERGLRTEVRADALLVGCLLALLLCEPAIREQAVTLSKWLAFPATGTVLLAVAEYHQFAPLWESIAIAVLISATMLHSRSAPARVLEWKPMAWLGLVSYSLYVWNPIVMVIGKTAVMLTVSLTIGLPLVTLGSYYLVEQPARRLGRRLAKRVPTPSGIERKVSV